jgi:hypothetical protein
MSNIEYLISVCLLSMEEIKQVEYETFEIQFADFQIIKHKYFLLYFINSFKVKYHFSDGNDWEGTMILSKRKMNILQRT